MTSLHYALWYAYHMAPSVEVFGFRLGGWGGAESEDICVGLMRGTSSHHWLANMEECLAKIEQNFYGCEGLIALLLLIYMTKRIIDAKPGLSPQATTTIHLPPPQFLLQDGKMLQPMLLRDYHDTSASYAPSHQKMHLRTD